MLFRSGSDSTTINDTVAYIYKVSSSLNPTDYIYISLATSATIFICTTINKASTVGIVPTITTFTIGGGAKKYKTTRSKKNPYKTTRKTKKYNIKV